MPGPEDIYHGLILDHSRHPRNTGAVVDADRAATEDNPLCGDRCSVSLRLAGDRIADVRFEGVGCAISIASASMMTERAKGLTHAEVVALFDVLEQVLRGRPAPPEPPLGDLAAFAAVSRLPVRAKCARLPWQAVLAALHSKKITGS
jgi:nitrogen fixation NifU-like protein